MTTLNIRCCCEPRRILGTLDFAVPPDAQGTIMTEHGLLEIREYYEVRGGEYYTELAVVAHEGRPEPVM